MDKEFVPYQPSLDLKELGFDEPCLAQYKKYDVGKATLDIGFSKNEIIMQFHKLSNFCSAPTFSQAFRWFREKYGLELLIAKDDIEQYYFSVKKSEALFDEDDYCFETYEEAELECLKKLIEIVKEKFAKVKN